ncbi:MAG: RND transporter [Gammaproteobacteria bacterium SG8_47]|nr:MAG: RND transporter [Gammaproteobacteria bacterium SG8_47]
MKRTLRRLIIVAVIVGLIGALIWYLTRPQPVTVAVASVERGRVQSTVANTRAGTVAACNRARLSPATGGQIASLPVREGDAVKSGQILLELWNRDLAAERTLAQREARAAQARAKEACTVADVTKREADRLVRLRKQGLASEESTDKALGDAAAKAAACEAAQASAEVGGAKIEVTEAALERSILRAPFDGTVAEINGEVGEVVTPSPVGIPTPPAIDLVDNSCLYVSAPIDEVDAPNIRAGMPARITLDAFPSRDFPATVRRVAPYVLDIEKQARTVQIEAEFDRGNQANLLPGYSADVEVVLDTREDVVRIPTDALLENNRVYVVDADNYVVERKVVPGLTNWEFTEITRGLQAGERIITSVDREGIEVGTQVSIETSTAKP